MSRKPKSAPAVTRTSFLVRVARKATDGSTPSQEYSVRVRPVEAPAQGLELGGRKPVLGDTVMDVIGELLVDLVREEEADNDEGHRLVDGKAA